MAVVTVPPTLSRRALVVGALGGLAACSADDPAPPPPSASITPTASATPSSTPLTGPTDADWSRLGRSVRGTLTLPSDQDYDDVRLLQNPRYDGQRPLAVLSVQSPQDVATGLAFAQDHAIPVAVRSGGHSYPGWSGGGSPPSLVIDCRPLNEVSLSGSSATIGSGAALAQVYATLGDRGRAIAGGSCATVGIAGLTLGGGVGVLTRAMGLTCDAVTSMRVVTADGAVRTATAQEEPDLFWALRGGGGGHLGVVTAFDFETSAAPTLQTFYLQWPISAAPQVVEAWLDWAPSADPALWSTLKALGGQRRSDGPILLVSGTWTGSTAGLDQRLAGLLDHVPAPSTSSRATRSYREAMLAYAGCASIPVDQCEHGAGRRAGARSVRGDLTRRVPAVEPDGYRRPAVPGRRRPVLRPARSGDLHRRPGRQGP